MDTESPCDFADLPPFLFRWITEKQARIALLDNCLAPSWTHLIPSTGRVRKGICFGEDPTTWRDEDDYVVCLAVKSDGLDRRKIVNLDGDAVFWHTVKFKSSVRAARLATDAEEKSKHRHDTQDILASLRRHHTEHPFKCDEWFMMAPIENLREQISAVVVAPFADYSLKRLMEVYQNEGWPVRFAGYGDTLDGEIERLLVDEIRVTDAFLFGTDDDTDEPESGFEDDPSAGITDKPPSAPTP